MIALLMCGFVVSTHWMELGEIRKDSAELVRSVQRLFTKRLTEDAHLMSAAIEAFSRNPKIQQAWLARDRRSLMGQTKGLFERYRGDHGVTHFYFHEPDTRCFLRVHKPERRGDLIKRFTMRGAVASNEPCHGIELGPLGTFTLRVVHPWYINGELAGYLELGKEIEDVTQDIHQVAGADLLVLIDKAHLNRAEWEAGMVMLGRQADWDALERYVVVDKTLDPRPAQVEPLLVGDPPDDDIVRLTLDRPYDVAQLPLRDAGDRIVGRMLVLRDRTFSEENALTSLAVVTALGLVLGGLLLAGLNVLLGRTVRRMDKSYKQAMASRQALVESESRLRTILNSVQAGIVIVDPEDQTIIEANPAALATMEMPADQVIGRSCRDHLCTGSSKRCPLRGIDQPVNMGEKRLVTRKGEDVPILKTVAPINLEGRRLLLETFVDISDSKRAQEQLKESEELYRTLFEASGDAIFLMTQRFVDCNQRACELFGCRREEIIGKTPADFMPPTQPDGVDSNVRARERLEAARLHGPQYFELNL